MPRRSATASLWALLVTVFAVPIVTGNLTAFGIGSLPLLYDPTGLPRLYVAVVGCLVAWALWAFVDTRSEPSFRITPAWIALSLFGLWAVVSATQSPHRALAVMGQSERLEGAVTIVLYGLLFGVALQVVTTPARMRMVVKAFGLSAVVLSVQGLLQYAGFDLTNYVVERPAFDLHRAFATTGNPNFLGGVLVLALPLVIVLAASAQTRVPAIGWSAASMLVATALFATFTRGAWLGAVVELVVAAVLVTRAKAWRSFDVWTKSLLAALAAVLVLLAVASSFSGNETSVVARLSDASSAVSSSGERVFGWQAAAKAILQRPLLGWGPDTFLAAFRANRPDRYVSAFGATQTVNNAHSWPINTAATTGLVGAALLLFAIASALIVARPSLRSKSLKSGGYLYAAVWVASAGFCVHMLLNVGVLSSTVPFWLLLGALAAPFAKRLALPKPAAMAAGVAALVLAASAVVIGARFVVADHAYLTSRFIVKGVQAGDPLQYARTAEKLNPLSIKYRRGFADAEAQELGVDMKDQASARVVLADYRRVASAYSSALKLDPNDYPSLARLAAIQAAVGTYADRPDLVGTARATARRALPLDRQSAQVRDLANGLVTPTAISRAASVVLLP